MEVFTSMLCLFFLIQISSFPQAQAQSQPSTNITLGSSISSLDKQSVRTSPSGEFSFGFSTYNGLLYIGIRFEKILEKPLVWTANRDHPAPSGSTVELTTDGRLILKDDKNVEFKTIANSSDGAVGSAVMLDSGNFVLQSSAGDIKWESFEHPTDTNLPGQTLDTKSALYAAASDTDISTGKYFLKMKDDGNLVVSWLNSPTDVGNDAYSSKTGATAGRLVFNTSGIMYILRSDGTMANLLPLAQPPTPAKDFYQRATVGYDGIFRQYSFPKNGNGSSAQSWTTVWTGTSDGPCHVPGICGLNGYCQLNNGRPDCSCPKGFDYINPNNRFMGCQQNFPVQQCPGLSSDDYTFEPLDNIDWPMGDFSQINEVRDESRCQEACLSDCLCTVAIYRDSTCWKKKIPMYNGRFNPSLKSRALIKIPKENNSMAPLPNNKDIGPEAKCKDARKITVPLVVLLCLMLGGSGLLNLFCFFLLAFLRRHRLKSQRTEPGHSALGMNLRSFTCKELEEATCGFKERLGKGVS